MPTDFRFNAQTSYSPLLTALAEAPANAQKLKILQQQNQRARLSDLLTQISSAASLSRQFQLQKAIKDQATLAGQQSPQAQQAALVSPDSYATGFNSITGSFGGLNSVMGPPSGTAPNAPSLAGEGVTPNNQNIPNNPVPQVSTAPQTGANPSNMDQGTDTRKNIIMNKLFPAQYEISTAPSGLRQMVSKIPGMPIIPIDKGGTSMNTGEIQPGQPLTPTQKKEAVDTGSWLTDQVKEFKGNDVYKNAQITIDGARRMRALTKANIPLSEINIQAAQTKLAGINRLTEVELERSGIDPGLLPRYQQLWSKMSSKGFIPKNKEELNQMADVLEKVQQDNLKDLAGSQVQSMQATRPDIPLKRHQAVINGAIGQYMKPIKSQVQKSKRNGTDLGNGFSYTIKQ